MPENAKLKRLHKVIRLKVVKPVNLTWPELAALLRKTRYRVFRLGNLAISDAYLQFQLWRTGRAELLPRKTIGQLNKDLARQLIEERQARKQKDRNTSDAPQHRFSARGGGALPDTVIGALSQYKIQALTRKTRWREVLRGQSALPSLRLNGPIYIRCDKPAQKRLEKLPNGDVALDLMICTQPYPRVILATGTLDGSARANLDKLLDPASDYRQRCFELRYDEDHRQWWVNISFDFIPQPVPGLRADRIVGVDVGWRTPHSAAITYGHARLGYRAFAPLMARVRSLQTQTIAPRRSMLQANRSALASASARSGHGRKRALLSTEVLQGRIDNAYTTFNHTRARALIQFATSQGAGTIQMEDLGGLRDTLSGTFLGQRWQYHSLQQFIHDKAAEAGIEVRKVNPYFTSRRCSQCGHIRADFDRDYRNQHPREPFRCPRAECGFEADPDYNAARNLATTGIEELIKLQCAKQGLHYRSLTSLTSAADITPADTVDASSTEATPGAIDAPGGEGRLRGPKD